MDTLIVPGTVGGTALRLDLSDGSTSLTVEGPFAGEHTTVLLSADWLLPLAAWFAGEAQPAALGARPGALIVHGDESAAVWDARTGARLECVLPFGSARVTIGPRGKVYGTTAMLPPEGRQSAAAWLRRTAAEDWARRPAA
ncbi:hypothetical protein ABTY20_22890 [Streptomyces sp. NPDC126497]|uniref:hypothetical protein n=1 Tax=Streptomyces sp. NPDC126497 TaxID=3155313 RepID=UPI003332295B